MPTVAIPTIVKDPRTTQFKGVPETETVVIDEEFFLNGPVSSRVAVLDFDPDSGRLSRGAQFVPADHADAKGTYRLAKPFNLGSKEFLAVSVFGAVHKALNLFEEDDTLGRKVDWAFEGNQLLVVPRAGDWANAFYERESHSLQFYFFTPSGMTKTYTCRSQDIIAHETCHAILDGIAPDLYDSYCPQSLALHEALADLTTLLMNFRSRELRRAILDYTGGSISESTAFSAVAPAFGQALSREGHSLRNLRNKKSLKSDDPTQQVDPSDPHSLSEVLSGALYDVMVNVHESLKSHYAQDDEAPSHVTEKSEVESIKQRFPDQAEDLEVHDARVGHRVSGKALFVGGERFKRMILRGLDYLPPGDASFVDYARAVIASDQVSHPESGQMRQWLVEQLVSRGIATAPDLEVSTYDDHSILADIDLQDLVSSDWVAFRFAEDHRSFLRIPEPPVPFEVRPRLKVTKRYFHRDRKEEVTECILKVSWTETEENRIGRGFPRRRRVRRGTTLAIDWKTKHIRGLLTSKPTAQHDRDRFLERLVDRDVLRLGGEKQPPRGATPRGVVVGDVVDGALRVRGVARALHIAPSEADRE